MSDVPQGWCLASIADTGKYINGFAFKPEHWGDAGRPIIRIQNLTKREREINRTTFSPGNDFVVRPGDILVSWSATLDAFIWDREEALLNQHIFRVIPESNLVTPKYLFYLLKQAIQEMQKTEHLHGSTMKHINRGPFMAHRVPIAPLTEQDRIVAEIEKQFTRLDNASTALKRVQANLQRYRSSVLKAAYEGRLVPTEAELPRKEGHSYEPASDLLKQILTERRAKWETDQLQKMMAAGKPPRDDAWRKKYKQPVMVDVATLPNLPEGWDWTTLDSLAQIVGGVTKGQKRKPGERLRSVPYLRVANVQRGMLDLSEVKTIDATPQEVEELTLVPGDILLNEGGDRDKLGRGWIWEGQIFECIHQNHVFRARMVNSKVQPKYISWYANSLGQQYFFDQGKQTTNLASLNMTKLKGLPIPLPPSNEQIRIVEELEKQFTDLSSLEQAAQISVQRANTLRQAVLKNAFSGKLVSQNADDEPASVLLERMRIGLDKAEPSAWIDSSGRLRIGKAKTGTTITEQTDCARTEKKPAASATQLRCGSPLAPRSSKMGTP